jgi:hypothetical protein
MSTTTAIRAERPEELRIFVERFMRFMNLWTIYKHILTGHHVPYVECPRSHWPYRQTNDEDETHSLHSTHTLHSENRVSIYVLVLRRTI